MRKEYKVIYSRN